MKSGLLPLGATPMIVIGSIFKFVEDSCHVYG